MFPRESVLMQIKNGFMKYSLNPFILFRVDVISSDAFFAYRTKQNDKKEKFKEVVFIMAL